MIIKKQEQIQQNKILPEGKIEGGKRKKDEERERNKGLFQKQFVILLLLKEIHFVFLKERREGRCERGEGRRGRGKKKGEGRRIFW